MGNLVQRELPQNSGGIGVGPSSQQKNCNISEMGQDMGPRLLLMSNGKLHSRF